MKKTAWDKEIEKRTSNIGFISRSNAFREPTPSEKASALAAETISWQETIGKRPYRIIGEYNISKGFGINLKSTRQYHEILKIYNRSEAEKKYIETEMDENGRKILEKYVENKKIFKKAQDQGKMEDLFVRFLPIIIIIITAIFFINLIKQK